MTMKQAPVEYAIRPYRPVDEPEVIDLLRVALGPGPTGSRTSRFFRWKHQENPFGPSLMLVAEVGERIAGLRAFMRWRFRSGSHELRAVTAVDTATHPDFQGMGIFSALTRSAIDALGDDADLVFNTPNEKSLPGYLKMGWKVVGRVPIAVRVHRPLRFAWHVRSLRASTVPERPTPPAGGEPVSVALDDPALPDLLPRGDGSESRIATARTLTYLRWRYASSPGLDYRAVRVHGDGLEGLGIFRVRPRGRLWECAIVETIVPRKGRAAAARVIRRVKEAVEADHLTCSFPSGTAAADAVRRAGYVRAPAGVTLVVNALHDGIHPDPGALDSWALTLGDLEVF